MFFDFSAKRNTAPQQIQQPFFSLQKPVAGMAVNDDTASRYSGYACCERIITETVAYLPWHVFQRGGSKRVPVSDHPLDYVLYMHPNDELAPFYFKELMQRNVLRFGNFYAEVERNRSGEVIALWPIEPHRVQMQRDQKGRIYYEVSNSGFPDSTIKPADMLHIRGPSKDGLIGLGILEQARESISLGMGAHAFGASFLGNGAMPSLLITNVENKSKIDKDGVKNLLNKWNRRNKGANKMRGTEYLDGGLDVKEFGFSAKDAQFIETANFGILDMCRWFRLPPHKLAILDKATWANIEPQNIDFVTDAIVPNVSRAENSANHTLLRKQGVNYYTKVNVMGLLRGDSAARKEYYKDLFAMGAIDIDEIREFEDMDALENNGDLRVVPSNMTTLERMKSGVLTNDKQKSASIGALIQETCRDLTKAELVRVKKFSIETSQEDIARVYVSHAQRCVDKFRNVAALALEEFGKNPEGIEEKLKVFFSDYAAQSADDLYNAIIKDENKMLLKSWEHTKDEKLFSKITNFLREC
jgi:HK97 family phage portal protein